MHNTYNLGVERGKENEYGKAGNGAETLSMHAGELLQIW